MYSFVLRPKAAIPYLPPKEAKARHEGFCLRVHMRFRVQGFRFKV